MARKLRLLSLDGGGGRGLSSLFLLQVFMEAVNHEGGSLKPCDYFDMICGTSTGGLIAIMLGRLRMSVEECIDAYRKLASNVFQPNSHIPLTLKGDVRARFSGHALEAEIKEVVKEYHYSKSEEALLYEGEQHAHECRVFVCTMSSSRQIVRLRSYRSKWADIDLLQSVRIWQAAKATSAATSFFPPMPLGTFGEMYVDGALGANNPVAELWDEARNFWSDQPLEAQLGCILSVGTGLSRIEEFGSNLKSIIHALKKISTETEDTELNFQRDHADLVESGRYCRLNVVSGLEKVGLEDKDKLDTIVSATRLYSSSTRIRQSISACVNHGKEVIEIQAQIIHKPPFDGGKMISPYYTSRDNIMSQLNTHREAVKYGSEAILLVHGLPGCGKTQAVRAYARQCSEDDMAIFWIDASSTGTLRSSLFAIAKSLQLDTDATLDMMSVDDINKLVLTYSEKFGDSKLFVYDNYDSLEEPLGYQLAPYLRPSGNGQVVITSRNGSPTAVLGIDFDVETLSVDVMSGQEATSLLKKILRCEMHAQPSELGHHIHNIACDLMCNLPLAVAQAGSYIRNRKNYKVDLVMSLKQYIEEYNIQEGRLLRATDGTFVKDYGKSLITTFDMALETIRNRSEEAEKLLLLFGWFHHRNIDEEWFEKAFLRKDHFVESNVDLESPTFLWLSNIFSSDSDGGWDPSELKANLRILHDYCLIYLHSDESKWDLHPLVHSWTIIFQRLKDRGNIEANATLAAAIMAESYNVEEDPHLLRYHQFRTEAHEHINTWLVRCQSNTNLLSRSAPTISGYTLGQLISFFNSTELRSEQTRKGLVSRLTSIALIAGVTKPLLDRYTLDKIERLLDDLREKDTLPVNDISSAFVEMRTLYSSIPTRSSRHLHFDIMRNFMRHSFFLRRSNDIAGYLKLNEELGAYTLYRRKEMDERTYFSMRSISVHATYLDPVRCDSILRELRLLHEEATLVLGPDHEICVSLRARIISVQAKLHTSDEDYIERTRQIIEANPARYSNVLKMILSAQLNSKSKKLGSSAPEVIEISRKWRDLVLAEFGPYHLEVIQEENLIFSRMLRSATGKRDQRVPNMGNITWTKMRMDIVNPAMFLIYTRIWHPETNIENIWTHLHANAQDHAIYRVVLRECIERLESAAHKLSDNYPFLSEKILTFAKSFMVQFREEENLMQEPLPITYKQMHKVWKILEQLSSAWSQRRLDLSLEGTLLAELESQRGSVFEGVMFLVQNCILMLLYQFSPCEQSPLSLSTLSQLDTLCRSRLGDHAVYMQFSILSALCYRLFGEKEKAETAEDFLLDSMGSYEYERSWETAPKPLDVLEPKFPPTRIAILCLEHLCNKHDLWRWYLPAVRITSLWAKSLATRYGFVSPYVLEKVYWCGHRSEAAGQFEAFQLLVNELVEAMPSSDQSEVEWLYKDVTHHYLPSLVSDKRPRAAIILAEGLKALLDKDKSEDSAEEATETDSTVVYWQWCFLKTLRISYAILGFDLTALELLQRQRVLEEGNLAFPELDETYRKSIDEDRKARENLLETVP